MNEGAPGRKEFLPENRDIAFFQRMQREPFTSLEKTLSRYRAGEYDVEVSSNKERRFALLVINIERLWAYFEDQHMGEDGLFYDEPWSLNGELSFLVPEKIQKRMLDMEEGFQRRSFLLTALQYTIREYTKRFFLQHRDDSVTQRLEAVVMRRDNAPGVSKNSELVNAGFSTAINVAQTFLWNAASAYQRERGAKISKEEFGAIMRNSTRLAEALSSMHLHALVATAELVARGEFEAITPDGYPGNFTLVKEGNGLRLGFSGAFLDRLSRKIDDTPPYNEGEEGPRFGCPAMYAKSRAGKTVVAELYEFATRLFEDYFDLLYQDFSVED